jgi:hypothetical protein
MSVFSQIEKTLDERFRKWTEKIFGASQSDGLVLSRRAILDEIISKVETAGRGRRIFPYNDLRVRLVASDSGRRELLAAAFGEGRLETDVREYLLQTGAALPRGLSLDLEIAPEGAKAYEISYGVRTQAPPGRAPATLKLVSAGSSQEYILVEPRTNIGRSGELVDQRERILRRNDVVLTEGPGDVNSTVSRAHAHIVFDPATGEHRIYDDASEHGTRIFRRGRSIQVPPGSRGERLLSGDEIYLGRVRLRFEVSDQTPVTAGEHGRE